MPDPKRIAFSDVQKSQIVEFEIPARSGQWFALRGFRDDMTMAEKAEYRELWEDRMATFKLPDETREERVVSAAAIANGKAKIIAFLFPKFDASKLDILAETPDSYFDRMVEEFNRAPFIESLPAGGTTPTQ